MRRTGSVLVLVLVMLCLFSPGGLALGAMRDKAFDPFTDNLLVDGELRFAPPINKDEPRKVHLRTPRYWQLNTGTKTLKGHDLPFDKDVKCVGDCSIRMDGTGGKLVFFRFGWGDTRSTMRHSWSYVASVRLKLQDVKGKVWVQVSYSWGRVKSKVLSGTTGWTEVPLEFLLDRGTNLLQDITVRFEGTGTVWVDDLRLRMKNPRAFRWWESWNGRRVTARLSEIAGTGQRAGILNALPTFQWAASGSGRPALS